MHRIILRLHENGRWRLFGNVNIRIGCEVLFRQGEVAGIDDHRKIRAAAKLVGGIHRIVDSLIEVRAEGRGEMSAARRIRARPTRLGSMCHSAAWARTMPSARCASCSAAGDLGYGPGIRHTVFQKHAGDVDGIQPVAHLGAFEINGENAVSASGE